MLRFKPPDACANYVTILDRCRAAAAVGTGRAEEDMARGTPYWSILRTHTWLKVLAARDRLYGSCVGLYGRYPGPRFTPGEIAHTPERPNETHLGYQT